MNFATEPIKLPVAGTTAKATVPEFGPLSSFTGSRRLTVWTPHPLLPPRCWCLHAATHRHKLGWFL